jgi:K+-sensing histidine kinase KdpD
VGSITGESTGLELLAGVALVVGAITTLFGALASAVQCWALYCGFLENRFGVLTLDPSSVWALSFLLTVGVLASALALVGRAVGDWVAGGSAAG